MSHQSHHHHHDYPNHGGSLRPHRQSPTGGDSHCSSLYLEGTWEGRTVLPPLTIAFPTSDSSGSLFDDVPALPSLNSTPFAPFDAVPTNVPNIFAQRPSPLTLCKDPPALPPLTIAFPTSDSPGTLFNGAPALPRLNSTPFALFDAVPTNVPNIYAQRSSPLTPCKDLPALPPLTIAFPTSDSPGSLFDDAAFMLQHFHI
jgi:hypothetical protein